MNKINYQGLIIESCCKYFYIHKGDSFSHKEDRRRSVIEVTFPEGSTTDNVSGVLGLKTQGKSRVLSEMSRPEKFVETYVTINGLKFLKTTYDQHILKIVIVNDSDSRVIQSYDYTSLIISEKDYKKEDFIDFVLFSGNLLYLVPVIPKKCKPKNWIFYNIPRIIIQNKSLDLESTSETVYSLRSKYDNYRIRSIDYQNQFVEEIRLRLSGYGIELCRQNREKTLTTTSYISYRFSQTPSNYSHPMYDDRRRKVISHRLPVEFELHCDNTQMFFDFKNKYNNVDFLTNFCEMTTMDKYGELWVSSIKWGRISEDFSQTYDSDSNSNFALSCQFNCELFFYEVFDDQNYFITEIIQELNLEDNKT